MAKQKSLQRDLKLVVKKKEFSSQEHDGSSQEKYL